MFAYLTSRRSRKIYESLVAQAAVAIEEGRVLANGAFLERAPTRSHRVIHVGNQIERKAILIYHQVHWYKSFLGRWIENFVIVMHFGVSSFPKGSDRLLDHQIVEKGASTSRPSPSSKVSDNSFWPEEGMAPSGCDSSTG
jgi:hypothetical protein